MHKTAIKSKPEDADYHNFVNSTELSKNKKYTLIKDNNQNYKLEWKSISIVNKLNPGTRVMPN